MLRPVGDFEFQATRKNEAKITANTACQHQYSCPKITPSTQHETKVHAQYHVGLYAWEQETRMLSQALNRAMLHS